MLDDVSLSDLLSLLALVLSCVAIVVTLAWRQRPFLRVELSELMHNSGAEQPRWRIRISNRGNGEAWDVRIRIVPGDGQNEVLSIGTLKPDQSSDNTFFLTPLVDVEDGMQRWADGRVDPGKVHAIVRWRALPVIRVHRRMKVKVGAGAENLIWYKTDK